MAGYVKGFLLTPVCPFVLTFAVNFAFKIGPQKAYVRNEVKQNACNLISSNLTHVAFAVKQIILYKLNFARLNLMLCFLC